MRRYAPRDAHLGVPRAGTQILLFYIIFYTILCLILTRCQGQGQYGDWAAPVRGSQGGHTMTLGYWSPSCTSLLCVGRVHGWVIGNH